jgi:ATP-dependent Lon protease
MRDFRDAKAMAQTLREALKPKSVSLTHSESLELVAKILGFHDWNVLSARIQSEQQPPAGKPGTASAADTLVPVAAGANLPTLPLRDLVLFPHMIVPLYVGRDTTKRALERAMAGDKLILVLTQRRSADDNPAPADLYGVGATASLLDLETLPDGTIRVIAKGLARAAVRHLAQGPFLAANVTPIEELRSHEAEAFALMREVLEKFRTFSNANFSSPPYARLPHIPLPGALADTLASLLSVAIDRKQDLLETDDVITRLEKILALMKTDQRAA